MGVVEKVKSLTDLALQVRDNDLKIEFQAVIIDLQNMMLDMQSEHDAMKSEIASFHDRAELSKLLRHEGNAYWKTDQDAQRAYCTGCFDSQGKLMSLTRSGYVGFCPGCRIQYPDVYGRQPPPSVVLSKPTRLR